MSTKQQSYLKNNEHSTVSPLQLAVQSFMISREAMACTPATMNYYKEYLYKAVDHFDQQELRHPNDITPTHIRQLFIHLQKRGLAEQTVHHYASTIRALFNFLVDEEVMDKSPMQKVSMPRRPKKILPAFTPEDVQNLLKACTAARDIAIILTLVDTGCRASEFIALNVGDVEIIKGIIDVRQGKGKKDRVTFIGTKARKAILKYLMERDSTSPDMPLWLNMNTGEKITTHGLRLMLRRVGKRANVDHCHPHTFRRTCALWSLRAGMNIYALQQIMGHADLTVLRRYLALVQEDLEDAHRKHGAVDNML